MRTKIRLDRRLCELGLAESGARAQRLIMAGLVYVDGRKADKPGMQVSREAEVNVRETLRYVSRGGLKLEAALKHFGLDVRAARCLDVGASTGGFTDCLLQHGAERVYAVDVGRGQLHYRLRNDPRVVSLERMHIRDLRPAQVPQDMDVLTIDTSFISLTTVLPLAWPYLRRGGFCLALIKPQFEVGPKHLRKGVVRSVEARLQAVRKVESCARSLLHARVVGVMESPLHGPKGNIEYLLLIRKTETG